MRVLYLVQYFNRPEEPGGSRAYQFATHWSALGHDVEIVTGGVNHKTGEIVPEFRGHWLTISRENHYTLRRVWSYPDYKGSYRKRYISFLSFALSAVLCSPHNTPPDLIFASSTPLTTGIAGVVLSKLTGIPLVFEARDLWPKAAVIAGVLKNRFFVRLAEELERWIYDHSDRIVVLSQGDRHELAVRGLPSRRLHWIPNGVDDWMVSAEPHPLVRVPGPFRIVYAGAHGKWNHLDHLLDLAAAVGETVHFTLIGDGDEKHHLVRRAERRKLTNIQFVPALPKKETFRKLQEAHASIIISGIEEHFRQWLPNKVFDYMAAARPVIVLGEGELARLVETTQCGRAGPPGNVESGSRLLREFAAYDQEQLQAFGMAGRRAAIGRFSRKDLALRMLEIFEAARQI